MNVFDSVTQKRKLWASVWDANEAHFLVAVKRMKFAFPSWGVLAIHNRSNFDKLSNYNSGS